MVHSRACDAVIWVSCSRVEAFLPTCRDNCAARTAYHMSKRDSLLEVARHGVFPAVRNGSARRRSTKLQEWQRGAETT